MNLSNSDNVLRCREDRYIERKRILVLAYVVSPYRGSEYSVAWNFVTQMSKSCELTVLFGASGLHMGDTVELERYLKQHPLQNVQFVPVRPSGLANVLNMANRRGWLTYTFYLAYRLWHREAYKVASELKKVQSYDLVHYLGPIGYREPGYLWKLDLPYVWGPIGGANNLPRQLLAALPMAGKVKLTFRAVVNWFQLRFSRRVRSALKNVDVLLTATTENQEIFRKVLRKESLYFPENGIVGAISLNHAKFSNLERIHLIWIGSIEARKALNILVEALSNCQRPSKFVVHVVGNGPLRPGLESKVSKAGLEQSFVWHGQISRDDVRQLLSMSHLHVVTSVSEGNPTTIWEAMSCGVPTLTIDHCGMRDTVTEGSGIKVPVADYGRLVEAFTRRLDEFAAQPAQLFHMAKRVIKEAPKHHWDHRPGFILERYEDAIKSWQNRRIVKHD